MAKKPKRSVSEDVCPASYEKLREEVFKYRIETKAQLKSFQYLVTFTTIVIAILAFFGYDKIDSVIDQIEERTNSRLSRTDSLLSLIDTRSLDSLTITVAQRTAMYNKVIAELERGIIVSKEYFSVVGHTIPFNKEVDVKIDSFVVDHRMNVIDIVQYSEELHERELGDCIVSIRDEIEIHKEDVLEIIVYPKGRRIRMYSQFHHVNKPLNRLPFKIVKFEGYKDYTLVVNYYCKKDGRNHASIIERPLKLID